MYLIWSTSEQLPSTLLTTHPAKLYFIRETTILGCYLYLERIGHADWKLLISHLIQIAWNAECVRGLSYATLCKVGPYIQSLPLRVHLLQDQKAGDYVVFRAEQDVVVAFSACPWDLGEMNGVGGTPKDASFQIFKAT